MKLWGWVIIAIVIGLITLGFAVGLTSDKEAVLKIRCMKRTATFSGKAFDECVRINNKGVVIYE